ncbi:MAG: hypothetical protein J6023_05880, partial [Clostridia bacterium]|nr:hypothetical protein [Clostridia bacterium]
MKEHNIFKGEDVEYEAEYDYCETTDEMIASEEMISANDLAMKNAYRRKKGLLETKDIFRIRKQYG